ADPLRQLRISLDEMRKFGMVHVNEKVDAMAIKISKLLDVRHTVKKECDNFGYFDDSTIMNQMPEKGNSVCVIGYPQKDIDWNKTSLKRLCGKVITCPSKDEARAIDPDERVSIDNCFCIDQPVEIGMSGSPVISVSDNNSECKLEGICSIIMVKKVGNNDAAVTPSQYIRDIIYHGRDLASYLDQKGY
ncbi:MAG: hypothetical protein WBX01_05820, partial [Nitrososphaeraceae archaeon]